jgi:hypothetical protein
LKLWTVQRKKKAPIFRLHRMSIIRELKNWIKFIQVFQILNNLHLNLSLVLIKSLKRMMILIFKLKLNSKLRYRNKLRLLQLHKPQLLLKLKHHLPKPLKWSVHQKN